MFAKIDLNNDDINAKEKEITLNISDIEKQFTIVKQMFVYEKNYDIDSRADQIFKEIAPEYLQPLKELSDIKMKRIKTAELIKNYRMENLKQFYEAELSAEHQNYLVSIKKSL